MDRRRFICRALDYADRNFGSRMVLDELAGISGYSVPQFSRLFTEFSGITPMRYVNIVRILNASSMLTDTDQSITNIAFLCGFDSLEVFERSFKRYFGVPASEYRKGRFCAPSPFYLSEQIYYERLRNMMIDSGNNFDWGRTADMYAKSRNIYPQDFWDKLHSLGVGNEGQNILDIGTGTGILPMNMQRFGGTYIGVDLSAEMIEQAKSINPNIAFLCADAHSTAFKDGSFDVVTALQCWVYFDKETLLPELHRILKKDGNLYIMFMTWLPDEDSIIRKTFGLVKQYNPNWSGFMKRADSIDFHRFNGDFSVETIVRKDYQLPFTRESWCDRMTASRGIGATLSAENIVAFRAELMDMLLAETEDNFTLLHEGVIIKLKREG
jgi:AraC-like DNA-binding protein/cyclopropane fatty-acyl-phospholipid synthase-like methyltransferase